MANNYSCFSEVIDINTDEERQWLEAVLNIANESDYDESEIDEFLKLAGVDTSPLEYLESWPNVAWSFEAKHVNGVAESSQLWVHAEENFNMDFLMAWVQGFLKKFRPNSAFIMTWADFCDKPRVGEFGGGAVKIMANDYIVKTAYAFRDEWEREAEDASGG